jgi:DNA-binding GntR family transcriptional regulator
MAQNAAEGDSTMTTSWPEPAAGDSGGGHQDGMDAWTEQGTVVRLARGETLKQRVSALIRRALIDGSLPAGSQVTVARVARTLGVSATPVREAMMHLDEAGLVSLKDGKIIIAETTPHALREAFELREALEGLSARLAAQRRSSSELSQIKIQARRSHECALARDSAGFYVADAAFHRTVGAAAHSHQLTRYVTNALDLAITLRNIQSVKRRFNPGAAHMHVTIASAIEDRDSDVAEQMMREHIRTVLQQLWT